MTLQSKDYITLIGIAATVIFSFWSLMISWRNSKKTLFINSVTSSRIKWMDTIRNCIAEYCGLILHIALTDMNESEERQIIERLDKLRFQIKLLLNRSDPYDKAIINKIDELIKTVDAEGDIDEKKLEKEIDNLICRTQDFLKLEWEGVKEESRKGNLPKTEKKLLYEKHLRDNGI